MSQKRNVKIIKLQKTILESVDTIVIIGGMSTSVTLSVTGVASIVVLISARVACSLTLVNKLLHILILNKYNKYKKVYEKDQQSIESFDKFYRKCLQDKLIDEIEYECLRNNFTK